MMRKKKAQRNNFVIAEDLQNYMFTSTENAGKLLQLLEYILLDNQLKNNNELKLKFLNQQVVNGNEIRIKFDDELYDEIFKYVTQNFFKRDE